MASRWIESGRAKRCLDLVFAIPAFLALAPISAVVALLVRNRLGRPIFYRQVRAGRFGQRIAIPKFRSMTSEVDHDGRLLSDADRLTTFGSKLRAASLDELPQLWTVIAGRMSLVGPRPLPEAYVERYSVTQRDRLHALPGITGWAQIHGRNAVTWEERLADDVWYVEHASLRLDLEILLRTLVLVVMKRGISADGHATMPEFKGPCPRV